MVGGLISWLGIRSALTRPATRRFPAVARAPFAATRGRVEIDLAGCNFCTLCQLKCPTGAIAVDKPGKRIAIDRLACILCGACVAACTRHCPAMDGGYAGPVTDRVAGTARFAAGETAPRA